MAAKIYNVMLLKRDGIDILLYVKDVKRISFKLSRKDASTIEMNIPLSVSSEEMIRIVEAHLPTMRDMINKYGRNTSTLLGAPDAAMVAMLKERLRSLVPEIELAMGVKAATYTIKFMTSRWGSCNVVKRRISINSALAHLPEEYTEYVLVHELAHIFQPNHSPAFWSIVARYCPRWRIIRAALKKYHP